MFSLALFFTVDVYKRQGEGDPAAGAVAGDGHLAGVGIDGDALKAADAPLNAVGVDHGAAVHKHSDAVGVGHLDGLGGVNAEGLRDIQAGGRAGYLHLGDRHGAGLGEGLGQDELAASAAAILGVTSGCLLYTSRCV